VGVGNRVTPFTQQNSYYIEVEAESFVAADGHLRGEWSQWCNRLLTPKVAGFVLGKGKRKEEVKGKELKATIRVETPIKEIANRRG